MKKRIKVTVVGYYDVDTDWNEYKPNDPIEVDKKALEDDEYSFEELVANLDNDVVTATFEYVEQPSTPREAAVDDIKNVRLRDLTGE